jgi:hypothetical protein
VFEVGFDYLAGEDGETGLDVGVAHHDGLDPWRLSPEGSLAGRARSDS